MARDIDSVATRTPLLPNIWEPNPKLVSIGMLRNPVTVCSWNDSPVGDVGTILERYGVFQTRAFVDPLGPIGLESATVADNWDLIPTHTIIIRTPSDVMIDKNHWIYRKTRYADQWFRVLRIEDIGERHRMTWLLCALVQNLDVRLDPATQKIPVSVDKPIDVSEHFI